MKKLTQKNPHLPHNSSSLPNATKRDENNVEIDLTAESGSESESELGGCVDFSPDDYKKAAQSTGQMLQLGRQTHKKNIIKQDRSNQRDEKNEQLMKKKLQAITIMNDFTTMSTSTKAKHMDKFMDSVNDVVSRNHSNCQSVLQIFAGWGFSTTLFDKKGLRSQWTNKKMNEILDSDGLDESFGSWAKRHPNMVKQSNLIQKACTEGRLFTKEFTDKLVVNAGM